MGRDGTYCPKAMAGQLFPRPVQRLLGMGNSHSKNVWGWTDLDRRKFIFGMRHMSCPEYARAFIYSFLRVILYHACIHDIFFMKNKIIKNFYLIILYKMYYKSNTELIYLSVTNT